MNIEEYAKCEKYGLNSDKIETIKKNTTLSYEQIINLQINLRLYKDFKKKSEQNTKIEQKSIKIEQKIEKAKQRIEKRSIEEKKALRVQDAKYLESLKIKSISELCNTYNIGYKSFLKLKSKYGLSIEETLKYYKNKRKA